MNNSNIRPSVSSDLPAIKAIIDAIELFPSALLDDMFLADDSGQPGFWLSYDDGSPIAVAYCAPEALTVGTWNLLLIAVHPDRQGAGIGAQLMSFVEAKLTSEGARVLLVETSGNDDFVSTRAFYAQLGYDEEARIREYYDTSEDKIVFRKAL